MLNEKFRYIAFDFETTGLDTKKDEPIQIGIVEFDHEFKIINSYQSLIKPKKNIKELKDIVRFITGFKLEDLEHAPTIQEILPEIASFFDETTVVVGHNIGFDIAILQNYLQRTPAHQLDTYTLSRSLFHFKPSYALDILDKELLKGQGLSSIDNYHDALADSHASLRVFKAAIERITHLRHSYLLLDYVIQESSGTLQSIIRRTVKPYKFEQKKLFFPALKKEHTDNKRAIIKDPYILGTAKEAYIGNISFHEFMTKTDWSKNNYVLAFTHKSKQHIAQKYLQENSISTGSLHDGVVFDPELVNLFLQKKNFSEEEILFVTKYYSHYDLGHTIMDINAASDYTIFYALTTRKKLTTHKLRLCTHLQLFQLADKIEPTDTVLFFDKERWYQNYSKHMKQAFDPLRRIGHIEKIQYKYTIMGEMDKAQKYHDYLQQCTVFVGVLSSEIDKLYINYNQAKREIDGILDNPRFPKTTQLFQQLDKVSKDIIALSHSEQQKILEEQRSKLSTYLSDPCEVEKKMYNGNQRYYLLHQQAIYLSYEDFRAQLPAANYQFLSNSAKTLPPLCKVADVPPVKGGNSSEQREDLLGGLGTPTTNQSHISITTTTDPKQLIDKLTQQSNMQFIISSSKHASQELFKHMLAKGLNKSFTIVAENITGGIGKNLYHARTSSLPVLCLGGYNFFLASLAERFDFSHIHLYHIQGSMKEQIVHDLRWYSS